jgi:hypothetical protein
MIARHFRITLYGHCTKKDDKKITSDKIQELLMDEFTESMCDVHELTTVQEINT